MPIKKTTKDGYHTLTVRLSVDQMKLLATYFTARGLYHSNQWAQAAVESFLETIPGSPDSPDAHAPEQPPE